MFEAVGVEICAILVTCCYITTYIFLDSLYCNENVQYPFDYGT